MEGATENIRMFNCMVIIHHTIENLVDYPPPEMEPELRMALNTVRAFILFLLSLYHSNAPVSKSLNTFPASLEGAMRTVLNKLKHTSTYNSIRQTFLETLTYLIKNKIDVNNNTMIASVFANLTEYALKDSIKSTDEKSQNPIVAINSHDHQNVDSVLSLSSEEEKKVDEIVKEIRKLKCAQGSQPNNSTLLPSTSKTNAESTWIIEPFTFNKDISVGELLINNSASPCTENTTVIVPRKGTTNFVSTKKLELQVPEIHPLEKVKNWVERQDPYLGVTDASPKSDNGERLGKSTQKRVAPPPPQISRSNSPETAKTKSKRKPLVRFRIERPYYQISRGKWCSYCKVSSHNNLDCRTLNKKICSYCGGIRHTDKNCKIRKADQEKMEAYQLEQEKKNSEK